MKQIPFILIYSRIVIAVLIGLMALMNLPYAPVLIVGLMAIGLITDILDGIIARKVGVATEKLRVWDSNTDQFFWIVVLIAVFGSHIRFLKDHFFPILVLMLLEASAYAVSYLRFRRTVATHSYLAKLWTLILFGFLVDLTLHGYSAFWFWTAVVLGIVSRLEILLIIVLMREWTTDVSSVWKIIKAKRVRN